jgi:DNA polymerase-3 subunit gamma/tau
MARILAKALNATDDLKEKDAIGDAILRGDDLDVIEIDAASNRGVQEARDLIAGAGLMPAPFKAAASGSISVHCPRPKSPDN